MTVQTKFFHFNQNNSGGYFVQDETNGVGEDVIIEAVDAKHAIVRLEEIGSKVSGFDDYCSCCGERWSTWIDDTDAKDEPMIYSDSVYNTFKSMFRSKAYIHRIDGSVEKVVYLRKDD